MDEKLNDSDNVEMKLVIEIPILFDGKLSPQEAVQFKAAVLEYAESAIASQFNGGARMFGVLFRYAFTSPTISLKGFLEERKLPRT